MTKSVISGLVVAGVFLLAAANGLAAPDLTCSSAVAGGTFQNVVVPAGASCTLDAVTILGKVDVQKGAFLTVQAFSGDITIGGHIKGDNCVSIFLTADFGSHFHRLVVGGNLIINKCSGQG